MMAAATDSTSLVPIQPVFTVHDRGVLQVRRRGGTPRPLARRPRPAAAAGLRVPRHRPDRNEVGARRARRGGRARPDLPARPQRASGIGGHRRRHRAPGPGTRAPDPRHHPQGRQGRHGPARPAHRPRHRPGHRRAHERAAVPRRGWETIGPAWRRTTGHVPAWTAMQPTSSRPTSPEPPGSPRRRGSTASATATTSASMSSAGCSRRRAPNSAAGGQTTWKDRCGNCGSGFGMTRPGPGHVLVYF
jgi:hypothetical protein